MTDWERIVREHGPMVFDTAWRILGHAADTEDVVQEVFLEVFRLRADGGVRSWPGYLRRMAACRALDRLRQKRRPIVSLNGLALHSPAPGPDLLLEGNEQVERVEFRPLRRGLSIDSIRQKFLLTFQTTHFTIPHHDNFDEADGSAQPFLRPPSLIP